MKKTIKKHLLLEQLEERVFFDANPIAAVEPVDIPVDHVEPVEISAADPVPDAPASQTDVSADQNQVNQNNNEQADISQSNQTESTSGADDNITAEATAQGIPHEPDSQQVDNDYSVQSESITGDDTSGSDNNQSSVATQEDATDDGTENAVTGAESSVGTASDENVSQIIFVDSSVTDHETLLNGIVDDISGNNSNSVEDEAEAGLDQVQNGIRIITLDASGDEFQQIKQNIV